MKRTRGTVKSYIESSGSSGEDINPPNKKSPSKTGNVCPKNTNESSSSESDIENYLQHPDKLDLDSEFFNLKSNKDDKKPPAETVPDFNSIEKEIFAGILQAEDSDSESNSDQDFEKTSKSPVAKSKYFKKKKQTKKSANIKKSTKLNLSHGKLTDSDSEEDKPSQNKGKKSKVQAPAQSFQQLEEYTKKIEEAKKFVEIYRAKKEAEDDKANILNLLAAGEGLSSLPQKIDPADLHSSDFESCDSEQEGWEEIRQKDEVKDDQKDLPKKNIEIAISMPEAVKKKTGVDLLAAMKRRLNRIRKENQVLIHKVHLLCWVAHGNFLNTAINKTQTLGMALSLLPSEQCYPADRTDLSYLEQVVNWYKRTIKCVDKNVTGEIPLDKSLQMQISRKEAFNQKMLALIFVAILRSLGINCRLVISLQVEPLRPPAKELHSLSTKNSSDKSKEVKVTSQSDVPSTSANKSIVKKDKKESTAKNGKQGKTKENKEITKKIQSKHSKGSVNTKVSVIDEKSDKEDTKSIKSVNNVNIPAKRSGNSKGSTSSTPETLSKMTKNQLEVPKTVRRAKSVDESETVNRTTRATKSKSVSDVSQTKKQKDLLNVPKISTTRKRSGSNDSSPSSKSNNCVESTRTRRSKSSEIKSKDVKTKSAAVKKTQSATNLEKVTDKQKDSLKVPKSRLSRKRSQSNDSVGSDQSDASVKSTKSESSVKSSKSGKSTKSAEHKRPIKVNKAPARQKRVPQVDGIYCSESDDQESTGSRCHCSETDENSSTCNRSDCLETDDGYIDFNCLETGLDSFSEDEQFSEAYSSENDDSSGFVIPQLDGPSVTVSKGKKPNLSKLTKGSGPKKTGQLDVRNDIMNLIKGRISEQKQIDKTRVVKKRKTQHISESSDSDYVPEPVKKKLHDSEDEFVSKTKVKRRIPGKSAILAEESGGKPKKIGNDFWVEVFLEAEEKWICVDLVYGQVHCVKEVSKRATQPVSYVLAWNNDGSLKDVTQRYCENFNTVTRKLRIDSKWWADSLKPFIGKQTARDKEEDNDLARQQLDQPLPKSIAEYKNHPLYVLKRHLLKFEALYPPEPPTLGFVRGEAVYPRGCVFTLHSRDIWLKQAKVVKLGEQPYKIVKARPKWDKLSNTVINDQMLEIFGPWQVEDYVPPDAKDGVVPRNAFGNVDLFKPCMLPGGCVHLKLPGLQKIARKLNIDCASAIVGFDFHGGWSVPSYDGFVVCKEFQDILINAWDEEQLEIQRKEEEKIEKRVYGNWKKLIKGLLIRERLKARYDFGEPSGSGTSSKEKKRTSKGPTFCTKKRRIHQNSESDLN